MWTDSVRNYEGYGQGLLEIKVDGSFVEWGLFNPSHVYAIPRVGTGDPVEFTFSIYDIYYPNNAGFPDGRNLRVRP